MTSDERAGENTVDPTVTVREGADSKTNQQVQLSDKREGGEV